MAVLDALDKIRVENAKRKRNPMAVPDNGHEDVWSEKEAARLDEEDAEMARRAFAATARTAGNNALKTAM